MPSTTQNQSRPPMQNFRKQMSQKDFDERRAKNRCFHCDQPYSSTHREKCTGRMFALEILPNIEVDEMTGTGEGSVVTELEVNMCPYISLNALSGITAYQTMRVKGMVGNQFIHILIDSGSTHNFLDLNTAKKLGCQLVKTEPLKIAVPGEHNLISTYACKGFKWAL